MKGKVGDHPIDPVGSNGASIQVLSTKMRIRDLCIERPGVISYLQTIQPEKQELALVHAIEVGVAEIVARRERFFLGGGERGGAGSR